MLKRYRFWLIAAILFQFLNAIIHSLSFLVNPNLKNDTEQEIHRLITTYREDMGAGFHRTFFELFTALSACYPLLCLLGGFTLGYLVLKQVDIEILRGVILINLLTFTVLFVIMFAFTFLPPIVMSGLIVANLLPAYILIPKRADIR